jgi:hypothetical protein
MKKTVVFGIAILLILLLCSCSQWFVRPDAAADREPAGKAGEEYAKIVNLVVEGSFSGDDSGVVGYLDHGAYGEELGELLAAEDLQPSAAKSLWFCSYERLPYFDATTGEDPIYEHGDVLLSRNIFSWTSNLLAWMLRAKYTHCGVFDEVYFQQQAGSSQGEDTRDVPAILSATLNDEVSGVTYETWLDWSAATSVFQKRAPGADPPDVGAVYDDYDEGSTEYTFFVWKPKVGLFPVPAAPEPGHNWPPKTHSEEWQFPFGGLIAQDNYDPVHWYCSKTTWWIYKTAGVDIENNELIDDIGVWGVRSSGLYKLYRMLFGANDATALAFCYFANDMCVWPDEIYTDGDLTPINSWGLPVR